MHILVVVVPIHVVVHVLDVLPPIISTWKFSKLLVAMNIKKVCDCVDEMFWNT